MQGSRELWLAGLAVALITALYAGATALEGIPAASGFLGHSLGVLGFLLMLATETLYSLRKRALRRPWGRMRDWLRFHIFTGIVGPYLVLLHSAWEFRGLAGVVTLLTVIVVLSGFTGRYIYTAGPRTADGIVLEAEAIQAEIAGLNAELEAAAPAESDGKQLAQRAGAGRRRRRLGRGGAPPPGGGGRKPRGAGGGGGAPPPPAGTADRLAGLVSQDAVALAQRAH